MSRKTDGFWPCWMEFFILTLLSPAISDGPEVERKKKKTKKNSRKEKERKEGKLVKRGT